VLARKINAEVEAILPSSLGPLALIGKPSLRCTRTAAKGGMLNFAAVCTKLRYVVAQAVLPSNLGVFAYLNDSPGTSVLTIWGAGR